MESKATTKGTFYIQELDLKAAMVRLNGVKTQLITQMRSTGASDSQIDELVKDFTISYMAMNKLLTDSEDFKIIIEK